jgi:2-keto-4-pentenoate hydratase/2-oxohepta-3-ene-1,7-dioic acid hydratase in catechol pathway
MKFATLDVDGEAAGAVWVDDKGWAVLSAADSALRGDLMPLISRELTPRELAELHAAAGVAATPIPPDRAKFLTPFIPGKIWGIGLNYRDHASDLAEAPPTEPASFMKGSHTVIGPNQAIELPSGIGAVTGEAELGLVIGRTCEAVQEDEALASVFGVCAILDQTAEDVLRLNAR